jgi:hypothetical protein
VVTSVRVWLDDRELEGARCLSCDAPDVVRVLPAVARSAIPWHVRSIELPLCGSCASTHRRATAHLGFETAILPVLPLEVIAWSIFTPSRDETLGFVVFLATFGVLTAALTLRRRRRSRLVRVVGLKRDPPDEFAKACDYELVIRRATSPRGTTSSATAYRHGDAPPDWLAEASAVAEPVAIRGGIGWALPLTALVTGLLAFVLMLAAYPTIVIDNPGQALTLTIDRAPPLALGAGEQRTIHLPWGEHTFRLTGERGSLVQSERVRFAQSYILSTDFATCYQVTKQSDHALRSTGLSLHHEEVVTRRGRLIANDDPKNVVRAPCRPFGVPSF